MLLVESGVLARWACALHFLDFFLLLLPEAAAFAWAASLAACSFMTCRWEPHREGRGEAEAAAAAGGRAWSDSVSGNTARAVSHAKRTKGDQHGRCSVAAGAARLR